MTRLSIILPYYNPSAAWSLQVWHTYSKLETDLGLCAERIIVNEGGTRLRGSELETPKSRTPALRLAGYTSKQGKGAALRHRVQLATGERLIYSDIDFPYTIASCVLVWNA